MLLYWYRVRNLLLKDVVTDFQSYTSVREAVKYQMNELFSLSFVLGCKMKIYNGACWEDGIRDGIVLYFVIRI